VVLESSLRQSHANRLDAGAATGSLKSGLRSHVGLTTRMELWDGGVRSVVQEQAREQYRLQQVEALEGEQVYASGLISRIVDLLALKAEMAVLEIQRQQSTKQYTLVKAQFRQGLKPQRDF